MVRPFQPQEWVINALNSGSDETRHVALQLFKSMEEHAAACHALC